MRFVFDLDGTICFAGRPVSETILECLDQLRSDGHDLIFASARPIRDMLPVLHERFHSCTLIGGNGALISINGNVESAQAFSKQQIGHIMTMIERRKANYLIDGHWDYDYSGPLYNHILNKVDHAHLSTYMHVTSLELIVKDILLNYGNISYL